MLTRIFSSTFCTVLILTTSACKAHKQQPVDKFPAEISTTKVDSIVLTKTPINTPKMDSSLAKIPEIYHALAKEKANYIQKAQDQAAKFTTYSSKLSMEISIDGQQLSSSAQLRIIKDSVIWISITPMLGIELARAIITKDSIKAVNRWDKTYMSEPISYLEKFTGTKIDFNTLQAALVGNAYFIPTLEPYYLTSTKPVVFQSNSLEIDKKLNPFTTKHIQTATPAGRLYKLQVEQLEKSLQIDYLNYIVVESFLFPNQLKLQAKGSKPLVADVQIEKIELNQAVKVEFKIPTNYVRIQ